MEKQTSLISCIVMLLANSICYSQPKFKTYSGEFQTGKATYSYYEDSETGNRIRHGSFKYTEHAAKGGSTYDATYVGFYKNGFKDGVWTYTIIQKDVPLDGGYYQTGSIRMVTTFKDGMPNGAWTYSENFKTRNKTYTRNGWYWAPFEAEPQVNIQVGYKNGVIAGECRISTLADKATGKFDDNGFMTGKWVVKKNDDSETELEVQNGIVLSYTIRRMPQGEVSFKSKYDSKLQQIHRDALNLSKEKLNELCQQNDVKVDILPSSNLFVFDEYFKSPVFMHGEINGDKTYIDLNDTKNYGSYILIERPHQNEY